MSGKNWPAVKIAPIVGPSPHSRRHPRRAASRAGEQSVEPARHAWQRLQGHPPLRLKAVLIRLAARRLDMLDILAADNARRRPDIGVFGAAANEPAVADRSTQSVACSLQILTKKSQK